MTKLSHAETFIVSAIPNSPARSVLGDLVKRSSLLLRVTDSDGATGWGEIWSNFPPSAAMHRAAILHDLIFPDIADVRFETPRALSTHICERWHILAHHTGETGPFENILAGLDIAVWDLLARKAGKRVSDLVLERASDWFGGALAKGTLGAERVRVYASSPDRTHIEARLEELLSDGHRAVKLKVGYGDKEDLDVMSRARGQVDRDFEIMIDANQCWTVEQALDIIPRLDAHNLSFAEEPIAAYLPMSEWIRLSQGIRPDIAVGENIRTPDMLVSHIRGGAARVFQPSVTKIGGVTGWIDMATMAVAGGMRLCPHYMGAAPGLAATLQLLSLFEGAGPMELDANDNALRTGIGALDLSVVDGTVATPRGEGLGFELEPEEWRALIE